MYNHERVFMCSHKSKVFDFPRDVKTSEGLTRIEHLILSIDDSEEKLVFLVKIRVHEKDDKPRLVAYLNSIAKTFNKIFANGELYFEDEVICKSNIILQDYGVNGDFGLKNTFFHRDFGMFMNLVKLNEKVVDDSAGEKMTLLYYLPRTSLFTGKDINSLGFWKQDLYIQ